MIKDGYPPVDKQFHKEFLGIIESIGGKTADKFKASLWEFMKSLDQYGKSIINYDPRIILLTNQKNLYRFILEKGKHNISEMIQVKRDRC